MTSLTYNIFLVFFYESTRKMKMLLAWLVRRCISFVFRSFLFVFFRLPESIVSVFEDKITKRKGENLLVPTIYLEHRKTGRRIVLIGMIHIGDEEYYQNVSLKVDSLENEGYVVFYEMLKSGDIKSENLSEKQKKILEYFRFQKKQIEVIIDVCDLVKQSDYIKIKDHWVNTDITFLELLAYLEKGGFSPNTKEKRDALEVKGVRHLILLRYLFEGAMLNMSTLRFFKIFFSKKDRFQAGVWDSIVLGGRNDLAVDELLRIEENVVATWGAGHLTGITNQLRKKGFRVVEKTWQTAFTRSYRTRDFLLDYLRVARSESLQTS